MRATRYELYDRQGRKLAEANAEQGLPVVAVYDGRGKIRSWLTFEADGVTPNIRFFPARRHTPKLRHQGRVKRRGDRMGSHRNRFEEVRRMTGRNRRRI